MPATNVPVGRIDFFCCTVPQNMPSKQNRKTRKVTGLVGGVKKRGVYQSGTRGVPSAAQIDVNSRLLQKKQRETRRMLVGRAIEDIDYDMDFVGFTRAGITNKGFHQVLSIDNRLFEEIPRLVDRQRDLFPFGYDRSTGKQIDAAGVKEFQKILTYEQKHTPYPDLIEVLGGASHDYVFPYTAVVMLAKKAHALVDPRKDRTTLAVIDEMVSFIRNKTPAVVVRAVDEYFRHAIVNGNLRVSLPTNLQKRGRNQQASTRANGNATASRRRVKTIRRR